MQQADKSNIQAHISIENVTKFMRNDTLELITAEIFHRTAADSNHRIIREVTGSKGIDALFCLHQIDGGYWHPGSQSHFLNQVQ